MKSFLTKIHALSFLCALPALANDVGLHNSSAQPTRAPVMIAQAYQAQQGSNKIDRTVGVCHIVPNGPSHELSAENVIEPVGEAIEYFGLYENRTITGPAKITSLQNPKHGVLKDEGDGSYSYQPDFGYLGKDQATVLVEIGGFKVKVAYFFQAINGVAIGNTTYDRLCGKNGYSWKISRASARVAWVSEA